jgi:uncharacterized protein (TIGR03067 family)
MNRVIALGLFGLLAGLSPGCGSKTPTQSHTDAPAGTPIGPPAGAPETPEEALKGLAGNWQVVSIQNLPPYENEERIKKMTARIEGKVITLSQNFGYFNRGEIRLDPAKSPKQFTLIALDETGKPRTIKFFTTGLPDSGKEQERPVAPVLGLYSLNGDRLTIALTDRDDYRPTELKTSVMENTGGFVTVKKRAATYVVVLELSRVK